MKGGKGNWNDRRGKWSVKWNRGGDRSWGWGYVRRRRIEVELWKEMEDETKADKEFDSHIVDNTLRQKFK